MTEFINLNPSAGGGGGAPSAHASTHATGGSDSLTANNIGAMALPETYQNSFSSLPDQYQRWTALAGAAISANQDSSASPSWIWVNTISAYSARYLNRIPFDPNCEYEIWGYLRLMSGTPGNWGVGVGYQNRSLQNLTNASATFPNTFWKFYFSDLLGHSLPAAGAWQRFNFKIPIADIPTEARWIYPAFVINSPSGSGQFQWAGWGIARISQMYAASTHAAQHAANAADSLSGYALTSHTHTPASIGAAASTHAAQHAANAADSLSGYALTSHTHTGFAASTHAAQHAANAADSLSGYALTSHTHTGFAASTHAAQHAANAADSLSGYALTSHTHTGFAASTHAAQHAANAADSLSGYALTSHTHTPASIGAAAASHTHDATGISLIGGNFQTFNTYSVYSGTVTYTRRSGNILYLGKLAFIIVDCIWSGHTGTGSLLLSFPFVLAQGTCLSGYFEDGSSPRIAVNAFARTMFAAPTIALVDIYSGSGFVQATNASNRGLYLSGWVYLS